MKLIVDKIHCDECGKIIEQTCDGVFEWYEQINENGYYKVKKGTARIVHRLTCSGKKSGLLGDIDLINLTDHDGLMDLLSMISDDRFEDKEDVLEIIKRLYIPKYDTTHTYFDEAISEGVFEPNTKPKYHNMYQIEAVAEYIKKRRD